MITSFTTIILDDKYANPNAPAELTNRLEELTKVILAQSGCQELFVGRGEGQELEKRKQMFWFASELASYDPSSSFHRALKLRHAPDPSSLLDWDKIEDHHAALVSSAFADFSQKLSTLFDSSHATPLAFKHYAFPSSPDLLSLLRSSIHPHVEIFQFQTPPARPREFIEKEMVKFSTEMKKHEEVESVCAASEEEEQARGLMLVGWKSEEQQKAATRKEWLGEAVKKFGGEGGFGMPMSWDNVRFREVSA